MISSKCRWKTLARFQAKCKLQNHAVTLWLQRNNFTEDFKVRCISSWIIDSSKRVYSLTTSLQGSCIQFVFTSQLLIFDITWLALMTFPLFCTLYTHKNIKQWNMTLKWNPHFCCPSLFYSKYRVHKRFWNILEIFLLSSWPPCKWILSTFQNVHSGKHPKEERNSKEHYWWPIVLSKRVKTSIWRQTEEDQLFHHGDKSFGSAHASCSKYYIGSPTLEKI